MPTYLERHGHNRTHKKNGSARRDRRRIEAEQRANERAKRTPQQQINKLNAGGFTATSERQKLSAA